MSQEKLRNVKVVYLASWEVGPDDLEKILWFAFSQSKESFLKIESLVTTRSMIKRKTRPFQFKKMLTRRNAFFAVLIFVIVYHLLMFPFFGLSAYFFYKSAVAFKDNKLEKTRQLLGWGNYFLALGKNLYAPARPAYLLFSVALFPDSLLDIETRSATILQKSTQITENGNLILQLLLKKDKDETEKKNLEGRIQKLREDVTGLKDDLIFLEEKLPQSQISSLLQLKKDVGDMLELIDKGEKILPHLDVIFGKDGEKKYLLLFANNMELRPGGGFIGSFGILTANDLTIEDIKVYDVYDADGQLTTHYAPPDPIRRYLNQPNWFLRDSAFSSDFYENYNQAKFFLEKEINLTGFSGGMLITTSAIQNLLEPFDTLYLSDFGENITRDNFYLKAQYYSEKNFFPGSIQKKSFLGSLTNQILVNLETIPPKDFLKMIKKSFDEKQLLAIFEDANIQEVFDLLHWSGKTIVPRCALKSENCVIDYTFPYDANLGVNKANFFVSRLVTEKIDIEKDGTISNTLTIKIKNDSPADTFPGGSYKNYFQVLIPQQAGVKSVTKDDTIVENFDLYEGDFKGIGFFLEIPPKQSSEIRVQYQLDKPLNIGKGVYQLIFQKQTGSKNSDFILEMTLPQNISVLNQNFSPLVKDNRIFYNTNLSADKIFFIELLRE